MLESRELQNTSRRWLENFVKAGYIKFRAFSTNKTSVQVNFDAYKPGYIGVFVDTRNPDELKADGSDRVEIALMAGVLEHFTPYLRVSRYKEVALPTGSNADIRSVVRYEFTGRISKDVGPRLVVPSGSDEQIAYFFSEKDGRLGFKHVSLAQKLGDRYYPVADEEMPTKRAAGLGLSLPRTTIEADANGNYDIGMCIGGMAHKRTIQNNVGGLNDYLNSLFEKIFVEIKEDAAREEAGT